MPEAFSSNPNLQKFIESSNKATRGAYNLWLVVGIVFFGPIILLTRFSGLKQGKLVIIYTATLPLTIIIAMVTNGLIAFVVYMVWYVTGWEHVNIIFEKYKKIATDRIKEIDQNNDNSFDCETEKGILTLRVLNNRLDAIQCLKNATNFPEGTPILAYIAALHLTNIKEYALAKEFINRTIQRSPGEKMKEIARKLERKISRKLSNTNLNC